MGDIRAVTQEDIPGIAALYQRVWGAPGTGPSAEFVRRLRALLFESPWFDEQLPSLVYEEDGAIAGFVGVLPRRMSLNGRPVQVAVTHSLLLDPASRNRLAGVSLLRQVFAGGQDLTLTDAANQFGRRVWTGLGGVEVTLSSLIWIRALRPCGYLAQMLVRKRPRLRPVKFALAPLCRAVDAVAARLPPARIERAAAGLSGEEPGVEELLESIRRLSAGRALRPEYDTPSLRWVLEMAARKREYGGLRSRLVKNADGATLGHYLYYVKPGGVARVLQLAVSQSAIHRVLAHLFRDAWTRGALAVSGQVAQAFVPELVENYCMFSCCCWVLVYSRDHALTDAVLRGDAFLTRLEGDWWLSLEELAAGSA